MQNTIVTGDESWVHHYQPESKRASKQWKHPSSPSNKKFKVSSWEGYAYMFWHFQGVLLASFQNRGENVSCASYCEVLLKLRDAVRRKRPGQLARGVLLHHDNARPHTVQATEERIQELQWGILEHPPYSLDFVPSDFHLFGQLETTLVADFSLMKRLKQRCGSG
jgi:histone-lysine N-methyltransferase SETMAR